MVDVDEGEAGEGPPGATSPGVKVVWSEVTPDGLLATLLVADEGDSDFERLEKIGGWERAIAWAHAHHFARSPPTPRRSTCGGS